MFAWPLISLSINNLPSCEWSFMCDLTVSAGSIIQMPQRDLNQCYFSSLFRQARTQILMHIEQTQCINILNSQWLNLYLNFNSLFIMIVPSSSRFSSCTGSINASQKTYILWVIICCKHAGEKVQPCWFSLVKLLGSVTLLCLQGRQDARMESTYWEDHWY